MCVKQFFHAPIGKFNTWLKRFDITIGCDDGCDKSLETYTKKSVSDDLDLFGYMKMCKLSLKMAPTSPIKSAIFGQTNENFSIL